MWCKKCGYHSKISIPNYDTSKESLKHKTTEIKGNFGICRIENCLDRLPKGNWDLIFTDTIWGHNFHKKAQKPMGINKKAVKQNRIPYEDSWQPEFHKQWFKLALEHSNAQVVCVGKNHVNWWIKEFDPIGLVPLVYKNGQGSTKISRYSGHMLYLCFGKESWWKKHKLHRDFVEQTVYETYIHNGFLRDNSDELNHPSPKDFDTWFQMISDLSPENVYDPFAGSCATGEVCEAAHIIWEGSELKPEYQSDIEFRIQKGMQYKPDHESEFRQSSLFENSFFKKCRETSISRPNGGI
jgi:hypothetical protein